MKMEVILTAISTVGFPIVAAMGCAWFIYQVYKTQQKAMTSHIDQIYESSQKRESKLCEQVDRFNDTLTSLNTTLAVIDKRLEIIETKILSKE